MRLRTTASRRGIQLIGAGTALFAWYVQNYGSSDGTYGALGAAVGFLTWIWLSLVVLLAGWELDCGLGRDDLTPRRQGFGQRDGIGKRRPCGRVVKHAPRWPSTLLKVVAQPF